MLIFLYSFSSLSSMFFRLNNFYSSYFFSSSVTSGHSENILFEKLIKSFMSIKSSIYPFSLNSYPCHHILAFCRQFWQPLHWRRERLCRMRIWQFSNFLFRAYRTKNDLPYELLNQTFSNWSLSSPFFLLSWRTGFNRFGRLEGSGLRVIIAQS